MRKSVLLKTLIASSVALVTVASISACGSKSPPGPDDAKEIKIKASSSNVSYQNVLQVKATANFAVNEFKWTLPEVENVEFKISGEHSEILSIGNYNANGEKNIFDIKASNDNYVSEKLQIKCLVNPENRTSPVSSDEQNPDYTKNINNNLLEQLKLYLQSIDWNIDTSTISEINTNDFLTEEEKYHQIFGELLKDGIQLVDHIGLHDEIDNIRDTQDQKIKDADELSTQQKEQVIAQAHTLLSQYENEVIDESFVVSDAYEKSSNFVEKLDNIDEEEKNATIANLELSNFLDNNEIIVKEDALKIDELINEQVATFANDISDDTNGFSIETTNLLSNVLSTKDGMSISSSSVSERFLLASKISDIDYQESTITVQFLMVNANDASVIYDQSDPAEYTFTLEPSERLDHQEMLEWFNKLDFEVNEDVSYDFLTERSGFEFNQYQDALDVNSVYSYVNNLSNRLFYSDDSNGHGVMVYGWTINFSIAKYDAGIFGSHSIKWLHDSGYIYNETIDLNARSARDSYVNTKLGWEDGNDITSDYFWNTARTLPMNGYCDWLGIYSGTTYNDAKMFRINNAADTTVVNFSMNDGKITSSMNANWTIYCNSTPNQSHNRDDHAHSEWKVGNWYTQYNDFEGLWESMQVPNMYNFDKTTSWSGQIWNNIVGHNTPMGEEVGQYGDIVPLTQVSDLLLFGPEQKIYEPKELSDKYELAIGFDKYYPYNDAALTGKVDFDIIVKNILTDNSLKINGFSGDFQKELTPEMFAAKLEYILEMADLLSEDPSKINGYMASIIVYTVLEGVAQVALIVLQIYDMLMICSLANVPFVGGLLTIYFFYELWVTLECLYNTVKMISDCINEYTNADNVLQYSVSMHDQYGEWVEFLESNLSILPTPWYIQFNSNNIGIISIYGDLNKLVEIIGSVVFEKGLHLLIKKFADNWISAMASKMLQKRLKISLVILIVSMLSVAIDIGFYLYWQNYFSDYYRFSLCFSNEFRWNYLYLHLPTDSQNHLDDWKVYIK